MSRLSAAFGIPQEAMRFTKRAFLSFVLWKTSYLLFMRPSGIPDRWLVEHLGHATVWFLDLFGEEGYRSQFVYRSHPAIDPVMEPVSLLYAADVRPVLYIEAPCNGLDLMVLSAGFVLCYPGTWRRKSLFVPICLLSVFAINVVRCGLLCLLWSGIPELFDSMHKFIFNLLAYACVFGLWMAYVGQGGFSPGWPSRVGGSSRAGGMELSERRIDP